MKWSGSWEFSRILFSEDTIIFILTLLPIMNQYQGEVCIFTL